MAARNGGKGQRDGSADPTSPRPAAQQGSNVGQQHSRAVMQDSSAGKQCRAAGQQYWAAMQCSSTAGWQCSSTAMQCCAAAVPPPPCTAPASCNGCNPPLQSACMCLSSFLSAPAQPRPAQPFHAFTACVPPVCTLPHMKWKVQFFQGL